jgi:hypothetical protein
MGRNSKRYTVSSYQGQWSIWSYAKDEEEYKEYISDIEARGFLARVTDRETKNIIYISKQ